MTPRRGRKGGIVLRFLLAIVLLAALGAGAAYFSLTLPYRGFAKPVILDFPRGTSTSEMASQLAQSGVIRYPWQFLMVRANTNFPNLRRHSESMPGLRAEMFFSTS
jgi:cell division protein YceG involved in septum cleavage